ncbi:Cof-type HAD-IIB family hydrolase [Gracilibacillus alcaliphilus]|uniref:Cof-type HAD-IIB family hydrolase n=1 Tax=Gracilibacillus alcaliphilus TaxID=1401441 RepID=UPI00195AE9FF|nr:Cof-type HAD-IIB family hydrolase [Gracilibacillus alcaliphilus]MBM7675544.1 Cof subfamily protein (haloacid dehalogenase superfamily) [Gracilibacillus alcaliphilus]
MKLIATDLDGTLLNENHQISQENKEALLLAQEQGVEIMVATGRSYDSARKPVEQAGLSCPILCLNGAKVIDENGELFLSKPMEIDACKKIQQVCQEYGLYFEVFTNKGTFAYDREQFIQVMLKVGQLIFPDMTVEEMRQWAIKRFQDEEISVMKDFSALFAETDIEVYKILAFSLEEAALANVRDHFVEANDIAITSSGELNLEFNHSAAQKGFALEAFAASKGIDMQDVMAIGDNYNDMTMLQMAGHGVAMGNADSAIKEVCNYVTKSNEENGVAYAIKDMLKSVPQKEG